MTPSSSALDQSTVATLLSLDPLVQEYRAFFLCLIDPLLSNGKRNGLFVVALPTPKTRLKRE